MQETKRVLIREELYERVWTTPVHRLAKEFGYSDVGLAKLCRKHRIPSPGLGYWRRVELGQKPPRTALPIVEQPSPYQIELTIRDHVVGQRKPDNADVPVVAVFPDKPLSHPHIIRLERLFRNAKKDEKSLLTPRAGSASHLKVTEGTFLRALQIANALFAACEEHGIQVVWPKEDGSSLTLIHESESVGFCISEILETRAHTPSEEETGSRRTAVRLSASGTSRNDNYALVHDKYLVGLPPIGFANPPATLFNSSSGSGASPDFAAFFSSCSDNSAACSSLSGFLISSLIISSDESDIIHGLAPLVPGLLHSISHGNC